MSGRQWVDALASALAGAALGVVALAGGTLVLYTGEGLLSAAGFLLALALGSAAAGVWVGLREERPRRRSRWTGAVVAFAAAAVFVEVWLLARDFRGTSLGSLAAAVFLIAEPGYVVGALVAALQRRPRAAREAVRSASPLPPAAAGLLGAAAGVLLSASFVVPQTRLGTSFLVAALAVAVAGQLQVRFGGAGEGGGRMEAKVVAITGVGGRGQVGYALAEAFLARGARVLLAGRGEQTEASARELAQRGDVATVVADLATAEGAASLARAAAERFGRLDVLVNAAGGLTLMKPVAETELEEWEGEIARNATTAYAVTRAALPLLRETRGAIVNFASPAGQRAVASLGAYAAAKAAVSALTRAVALEERGRVRVNAVAPGLIDTEQNRAALGGAEGTRWVTREQVAQVVVFLTSDAGAGINGQVIELPGEGLE